MSYLVGKSTFTFSEVLPYIMVNPSVLNIHSPRTTKGDVTAFLMRFHLRSLHHIYSTLGRVRIRSRLTTVFLMKALYRLSRVGYTPIK